MKCLTIQVGNLGTNCYLLSDGAAGVCAVVDPGGSPERILRAVQESGCRLEAVFLTHGHYDHTAGVEALRAAHPAVRVYLNRRDAGMEDEGLFPPVPEALDYDEGDSVQVGNMRFAVLATPGHSPGSVTLRCGDLLLCGDTLFAGSMGRTDLPGGSEGEIFASLARLAALPGRLRVLPGHMESSSLERERAANPFVRLALEQG